MSENVKPILTCVLISQGIQYQFLNPSRGQETLIANPTQIIRIPAVPSAYSIAVTIGIRSIAKESVHTLHIVIRDVNDDILYKTLSTPVTKDVVEPFKDVPDEYCGFIAMYDIRNVVFKVTGAYNVFVYMDDELIGTSAFYVADAGKLVS